MVFLLGIFFTNMLEILLRLAGVFGARVYTPCMYALLLGLFNQ